MSRTVVPQATQAIFDLFHAATRGHNPYVATSVGPPPGGDIPDAYLAVGYGGDDRASVTVNVLEPDSYNRSEHSAEDFEVWCTISTAGGDQNGAAQMVVTQGIYNVCASALIASPTLNGVLKGEGLAQVGSAEWVIDEGGAVVTLFFTGMCRARWIT